jgi:hypothetical protein
LLVVIAIIALLVSILLPALSQAKRVANRTLCKTNQRAIATAVQLYAQDWDMHLPYDYRFYISDPSKHPAGESGAWWYQRVWSDPGSSKSGVREGYIQKAEGTEGTVWHCPLFGDYPTGDLRPGDAAKKVHYGMSGQLLRVRGKSGNFGKEIHRLERISSGTVLLGETTLWGSIPRKYTGSEVNEQLGTEWGQNEPWPVHELSGEILHHDGRVNLTRIDASSVEVTDRWDSEKLEPMFTPQPD